MKESKVDLLIHPIRLQIVQALIGGRKLTRQQLSELLPDIPQATMYRHLNKLVQAELLLIVEEKQVRGAIEKVYSLPEHAPNISAEDLLQASREDQMGYFIKFLSTLIAEYGRYLNQDSYDLWKDGVSYRQIPLYLSDEEFKQLATEMSQLLLKAYENKPSSERRRRMFTTIIIPEATKETSQSSEE